ncbi:hypothetical protein BKI52_43855 [marine bacterium AO1-C]|nr:hypothetical protein BKI52_43855 [marine bacterium AO1-C]
MLKNLFFVALMATCALIASTSNAHQLLQNNEVEQINNRSRAGCDNVSRYSNVRVDCTSGSITVKAYLNGTHVNTVSLSAGQFYNFLRSSSSQLLKLEICWSASGGYYTWQDI